MSHSVKWRCHCLFEVTFCCKNIPVLTEGLYLSYNLHINIHGIK